MRRLGLGTTLMLACFFSGEAAAAESAGEAIKAFGLVGSWSTDCAREPMAVCEKDKGCGNRTIYQEPPLSGPPMIKSLVGGGTPDTGRTFQTVIESAVRIADDKIKILSIQQGMPSDISRLAWLRQPGDRWQTVLMKEGNDKYRIVSAQSEDGRKISAKDGFMYMPPPGTKFDEIPANFLRSERQVPAFERCLNETGQ
jgi:hypothetical protein